MKKFEITRNVVVAALIILIALPLVIQLHWVPFYQLAKLLTPGSSSNWLQFWGSYFGFVPTGIVTYVVLDFQFSRQEIADKRNNKAHLKLQRKQFIFEKKYSKLEQQIIIINDMINLFFTINNTFSNYNMSEEFAKTVLPEFTKTIFIISEKKVSFEAISQSYFDRPIDEESNIINRLELQIKALDWQRKLLQSTVVNLTGSISTESCNPNDVITATEEAIKDSTKLLQKLNSILKDMNNQELIE